MAEINTKSTSKALFKNTGIIAIGQLSTKILSFLLLPLYTALLSSTEYGLIDLLSTYSAFITVIVGLQLSQAIFRFLATNRDDEEKICNICSSIFFSTLVLILIYSVVFAVIQPYIKLEYKWFLLLNVIASIFLQTASGMIRGLGNNGLYAFGNFISTSVILVLNVIVLTVMHKGVAAMLISNIIGPFAGGIVICVFGKLHRHIRLSCFSKKEIKVMLSYAIPLVPNELSWSLIHSSDRMIISNILSIAANGLIAVASKFSYVYTTAFSIFNTSWTEQVVIHYKDNGGPKYISDMFNRMITFFGCLAIGIIACMPFVYSIFINEQYSEGYGLVPFYMIAVFFNAVIGMISAIYLVHNETKKVAISTGVAAAVNIIVDLALVKIIGVYAAPVSSICGYLTISAWRVWDVNKRYCSLKMEKSKLLILLFMLVITLLTYWINAIVINAIVLIAIAFISILLNKDFIIELKSIVIRRGK